MRIEHSAFAHCSQLREVIFDESAQLDRIPNDLFYDCTNLEYVNIPASIKYIENGAFGYCTSLREVKIPNKVVRVGDTAFFGCK